MAVSACLAQAQAWPTETIRLIVPYAPGGGNDNIGRLVAKALGERLKVQVIVDNKGGANGIIGMQLLKQSKPDGYTLAVVPTGPLDVNPALYPTLPYDPVHDFVAIGPMVKFPLFMAVSKNLGVKNLKEFLAKAKAEPGKLTYSSAGTGNSTHLAGALLAHMTGTQLVHVPYKGSGPAALALVAGEVSFTFGSGPSILEFVKANQAVGLGVSELARVPYYPDVPTIAESGVPGYEVSPWAGIVAPTGTPPKVVEQLSKALMEVMRSPEMVKATVERGMVPLPGTAADFERMMATDRKKFGDLIVKAHIKAE